MNDNVAMFVATLFHSGTNAHFFHLSTNSYAQHKALQKYYESIIDLTDSYAEAYMGCYEQLKKFPSVYHLPTDPLKYLQSLNTFVCDARKDLPDDTQLQNIIDEIAQLIDSTIYKLKNLK
jgi:hypothetical protein